MPDAILVFDQGEAHVPVASGAEIGLTVNAERLAYWEGVGAQLSPTAARLVKQFQAKKAA